MAPSPEDTVHTELSRPSLLWWPAGLFVVASVAIAYASMMGPAVGAAVMLAGVALLGLLTYLGSWRVRVAADRITVGSASVATSSITSAQVLDPEQARHLAGPGADARAVLRLRGGQPAVRIGLDDPACPYWLVSTRDPGRLAAAVERVAGAGRADR